MKEELYKLIEEENTEKICEMIQGDVLDSMDNEEVKRVFRLLMQLRNLEVIDALAKRSRYFPPEMLDIEIHNHNDKDFVANVLSKYGKKFRFKDPDVAGVLFETACKAECLSMLNFLLGKGLAEWEYPRLISGSEKLLPIVEKIRVAGLHPDTIVTFFVEAAISDQCEKRIQNLMDLGFKITTVNSEGKTAVDVLRSGIESFPYSKDKKGQQEKLKDEQGLKTLQRFSSLAG